MVLPLASAQDAESTENRISPTPQMNAELPEKSQSSNPSSQELVARSWEASGKNDLEKVIELTTQCEDLYGREARKLEAQLKSFPPSEQKKDYRVLNDVATCLFIRAEALMNNGKTQEAQVLFQKIVDEFKWAQAWDPRGWFWSVAEKSQASIDVLTGKAQEDLEREDQIEQKRAPKTKIKLDQKGTEDVIDYRKYGKLINVGTKDYRYELTDPQGLAAAAGEGIYPNNAAVVKDPGYKKALKEGRLEGNHWDFVHSDDWEAAFYKWATAPEPWGVKLFYLGVIFEKAKMYYEAIKAYHAIVVHFPNAVGWTYWQTPWYPGQAAIAKIRHIIRQHPELDLKFQWARIQILNGFDNDIRNDAVITYPGIVLKKNLMEKLQERFDFKKTRFKTARLGKVKKKVGEGKVRLVQYENNHWQLLVAGKPYLIQGITYHPTQVGQSPDKGTLVSWMTSDVNGNGKADGPYDSWVDKNRNDKQDADEPVVGDFQLMKEMGVNTIREYHQPFPPDKNVLRKMYKEYGIRVIMGDYLGKYALGSGASWYPGTDYENPEHRRNMLESVKKMVMEFKDEPYILMWLLGNENNYGVANNADTKPVAYFQFVNEVARWIKSVDRDHPVALCNGDTLFLDLFSQHALWVDVFSANSYRGDYGFGSFWEQVLDATGKPAFITEYGCPAYVRHMGREESEEAQEAYHKGNWLDIEENTAGYPEGVGNSLGGMVFEWTDEWWKNYEPFLHDRKSDAIGPFPGGYYFEEWFGITSQGKGQHSPFLRQLRKSYFTYQKLWQSSR